VDAVYILAFHCIFFDYTMDEVYYVIEGNAFIKINGNCTAKTEHKFHGNMKDLVIFYVLSGRD
jgi:hypothetical protein